MFDWSLRLIKHVPVQSLNTIPLVPFPTRAQIPCPLHDFVGTEGSSDISTTYVTHLPVSKPTIHYRRYIHSGVATTYTLSHFYCIPYLSNRCCTRKGRKMQLIVLDRNFLLWLKYVLWWKRDTHTKCTGDYVSAAMDIFPAL